MDCANCGNDNFYEDAAPNGHRRSIGTKYICIKCGFKATAELHKKRNLKKLFGGT